MNYTDDQRRLMQEIADKNGWTVEEVEEAVQLYLKRLMERVEKELLKLVGGGLAAGGVISHGAIEYPRQSGEYVIPNDLAKLRFDIHRK